MTYTSLHTDSPPLPLVAQLGLCTEETQQTTAENTVKEAIFNAERFSNVDCCTAPQGLVPTQLQVGRDVDVGVGIWGWGTSASSATTKPTSFKRNTKTRPNYVHPVSAGSYRLWSRQVLTLLIRAETGKGPCRSSSVEDRLKASWMTDLLPDPRGHLKYTPASRFSSLAAITLSSYGSVLNTANRVAAKDTTTPQTGTELPGLRLTELHHRGYNS